MNHLQNEPGSVHRFVAYAVSDINASRHFYENILGLKLTQEAGSEWFEYYNSFILGSHGSTQLPSLGA